MMTAQAILVRLAVVALIMAPSDVSACMPDMVLEVIKPNHMKRKCQRALLHSNRFLAEIKKGRINDQKLRDFVVAFDEGKYGCDENSEFTFRIIQSYYSIEERRLSDPVFLKRYALNFPVNYDRAEQSYISGLIWLFSNNGPNRPNGWTADQARTFVEMPKHWPIALARFGNSDDRDDAVFASVVDPQSRYFDRQQALRLAGVHSSNKGWRRIRAASLFVDPRFGPSDFAKAEELLPVSALFRTENPSLIWQEAQAAWVRVVDAYVQSSTPAIRDKGLRLRAKMLPPTPGQWLSFAAPRDGRVWLSLNDWPRSTRNPFSSAWHFTLLTAYDYPPSALREVQTGSLTLGVRFGRDGKFSALEVIQSSGNAILDDGAVKPILRRFRPRLANMTLEGHRGHEVMVPLLVVNWDISPSFDDASELGISNFANGILSVVATPIPETLDRGCGFSWSGFL